MLGHEIRFPDMRLPDLLHKRFTFSCGEAPLGSLLDSNVYVEIRWLEASKFHITSRKVIMQGLDWLFLAIKWLMSVIANRVISSTPLGTIELTRTFSSASFTFSKAKSSIRRVMGCMTSNIIGETALNDGGWAIHSELALLPPIGGSNPTSFLNKVQNLRF